MRRTASFPALVAIAWIASAPLPAAEPCIPRDPADGLQLIPTQVELVTVYAGTRKSDGARVESPTHGTWYALEDPRRNLCTSSHGLDDSFEATELVTSDDPRFDPDELDNPTVARGSGSEIALDMHWAGTRAWDYFSERHGWKGMDGEGGPVRISAGLGHEDYFDVLFADLHPRAGTIIVHGGQGGTRPFLGTLDVVAHEYAHGVVWSHVGEITTPDARAVDEGLADLFGLLVEARTEDREPDWTVGEKTGRPLRAKLDDPAAAGRADTYLGDRWEGGKDEDERAYVRSGVATRWFRLLVSGGAGTNDLGDRYEVSAIGLEKAEDLLFGLLAHLPPEPGFRDARHASIHAATRLFGACSTEEEQVARAWHAVGVGPDSVAAFSARLRLPDRVVTFESDQNRIDPNRIVDPTVRTRENPLASLRALAARNQFAKHYNVVRGEKDGDRVLPFTRVMYKNYHPLETLSVDVPSYSAGTYHRPAAIYDDDGDVLNSDQRDRIGVGILVGAEGYYADEATIQIDSLDLDCAITGSFTAFDHERRPASGVFRFQVVEYYDTERGEMVQVEK